MLSIAIVDYSLGNLLSLERAVNYCGGSPFITSDPQRILMADRIIMPGVGAFPFAMERLVKTGLDVCLKTAVEKKKLCWEFVLECNYFSKKAKSFS